MEIFQIDGNSVGKAVEVLKAGGVVVSPTDTVYGFLADMQSPQAIEKIFQIKERDSSKPLGIFVKDLDMAKDVAVISSTQEEYLKEVWPGKVTAVLDQKGELPKELGVENTIGVRVPDYPLLIQIIERLGNPVVQTSANIAGDKPLGDAEEIKEVFGDREYAPDILLDAGALPASEPSTVIDITGNEKKILR